MVERRFTMDEGLSRAVLQFVRENDCNDGLIYKDKRLVNWDPTTGSSHFRSRSAAGRIKGIFWHIKYPTKG